MAANRKRPDFTLARISKSNSDSAVTLSQNQDLHQQVVANLLNKLKIDELDEVRCVPSDFEELDEIGSGEYGSVSRMLHRPSERQLAVKRIHLTGEELQNRSVCRELEAFNKIANMRHDNIIPFYGLLFHEGDYLICMQLMDTCLDKFYKCVYHSMHEVIPELVLGNVLVATVQALNYLKQHDIIHRDVKPCNILMSTNGSTKLCDFGICGFLVDSVVQSNVGCRPYLAPERIKMVGRPYDIRNDVWSLGISLYEISTGEYPYPRFTSIFAQIDRVVDGDPPQLTEASPHFRRLSSQYCSLVNSMLTKDYHKRPKYDRITKSSFYKQTVEQLKNEAVRGEVGQFYHRIISHLFALVDNGQME